MYRTPLKNSKNVSKPFKSPFDSPALNKDQSNSCDKKRKINDRVVNSPLARRCNLDAKRVLILDEEEKEKKNLNIVESKNVNLNSPKNLEKTFEEKKENKKLKTVDTTNVDLNSPRKLIKSDLLMLKKKTFEVRQELESIKSREMCTKKNDPQQLRDSINKWRTACQSALEILCSETSERNGQSMKISHILNTLNIPEKLVQYSEKDDSFREYIEQVNV